MTERKITDRILAGYRVEVGRHPFWMILSWTPPISPGFPTVPTGGGGSLKNLAPMDGA